MAEPYIRVIREEDVRQIHEIETLCFAMPWSEESILHDVRENVVARWLVLDDGEGRVLAHVPYDPAYVDATRWSDNKRDNHNRGFRFLSCVAYLDGVHPSLVMCRGYYDRSVLTAWDWNGKSLKRRWQFDSWQSGRRTGKKSFQFQLIFRLRIFIMSMSMRL